MIVERDMRRVANYKTARSGVGGPQKARRTRLVRFAAGGALALIALSIEAYRLSDNGPDILALQGAAALAGGGSAPPSPAALIRAEQLARRELAWAPDHAAVWTRLSYVENERSGRFAGRSAALLQRGYDVAPFDVDLGLWRINFVFSNWAQAPAELRQRAATEAGVLAGLPGRKAPLERMVRSLADPAARFALLLAIEPAAGAPTANPAPINKASSAATAGV